MCIGVLVVDFIYDLLITAPNQHMVTGIAQNLRKGAATNAWTTTATGATLVNGQGFLTMSPPSPANTGSVSVAINLGSTSTDSACLTSHPTTVGGSLSYLRGKNGSCTESATFAADPSGVATFGVFTPESTKTIHLREVY